MGGMFSSPAPVAPVQDNSAQIAIMEQTRQQNEQYLAQLEKSNEGQYEADLAAQENLRQIELQDAQAESERLEREKRIKKQKRDLLYMNATGVDEEDEDMLLLGGD